MQRLLVLVLACTGCEAFVDGYTNEGDEGPVDDRTSDFADGELLPDLPSAELRRLPVPGGIGAGVQYKTGAIRVTSSAQLRTKMFVYPSGIGALPNWIFTTSTNRTEKTIEVVGIYNGSGSGSLGIFDWSCMPGYPCSNGATGASWIWTKPFSSLSCNYRMMDDGGGHQQNILEYRNKATRLDGGSPPLWKNEVYVWNYCSSAWDLVYNHSFRASQKDCSADNSCGWWGPIIETFVDGTQPPINEVGFLSGTLTYDGNVSTLGTDVTAWTPVNSAWSMFHQDPNRSWGAGSIAGPPTPPELDVVTPVANQLVSPGTSLAIGWAEIAIPTSNVRVYLFYDNSNDAAGWIQLGSVNVGVKQYTWSVPALTGTTTLFIGAWDASAGKYVAANSVSFRHQ